MRQTNKYTAFALYLITVPFLYAAELIEDLKPLGKASLTSAAAYYGGRYGSALAVDLTTKAIMNTVRHNNVVFDTFVGGVIRGKSLQEALPAASERGACIGAASGVFLVTLGWGCISAYDKTFRDIYAWLNKKNSEKPQYVGTIGSYLVAGLTTGSLVVLSTVCITGGKK